MERETVVREREHSPCMRYFPVWFFRTMTFIWHIMTPSISLTGHYFASITAGKDALSTLLRWSDRKPWSGKWTFDTVCDHGTDKRENNYYHCTSSGNDRAGRPDFSGGWRKHCWVRNAWRTCGKKRKVPGFRKNQGACRRMASGKINEKTSHFFILQFKNTFAILNNSYT